jgi:ATP-GRASP peptide maturase of grasp-with-spasm system
MNPAQKMGWLRFWSMPVVRINGDDFTRRGGPLVRISKNGTSTQVELEKETFDPSKVKVVWFRRWDHNNRNKEVLFTELRHQTWGNSRAVDSHLGNELSAVRDFFFSSFTSAKWLGDPLNCAPNKLHMLKLAASLGLDIPETLVTTDPEEVRRFAERHGEIVAKAIRDMTVCVFDDSIYMTYTGIVPDELLQESGWPGGFPSLFQEKLSKKYEIRSFYLDGNFYSMAMFTQNDVSTRVDSRRYQDHARTRCVPYALPTYIEDALRKLMEQLRLETASIDVVRTLDDRFVFLEANPIGQFGMTSYPCNYSLEEKIAKALMRRYYEQ